MLFWLLTAPCPLAASALPVHTADTANGERIHHARGCVLFRTPASAPPGAEAALPSGGHPFKTPIGTLYPPNLTPDPETGLGRWSNLDFVNAVLRGVSPQGRHHIPAFPYACGVKMKIEDVLDLRACLASLPAVRSPDVRQASLIDTVLRRGIGLWKWTGLDDRPFVADAAQYTSRYRGACLVAGPGHCGGCHARRHLAMAPDQSRLLAGGPRALEILRQSRQ